MDDTVALQKINEKSSRVHVEDNLLFVLTELTGDAPAQVMGYFMDRAVEASRCPSNCFRKMYDVDKKKYVRVTVGDEMHRMTVLRGFYPGTPIAYKLIVAVGSIGWIKLADAKEIGLHVNVTMIAEAKAWAAMNFSEVVDASTRESLVGDRVYSPKIKRPKALTPTGATPQHYKPVKKRASPR